MFKVYIVGKWGKREEVAKFKTREEAERFASKIKEYMRSGLEGLSVEVVEKRDFGVFDAKTVATVALFLAATFIASTLPLHRGRR
jgi:hypothetical protein